MKPWTRHVIACVDALAVAFVAACAGEKATEPDSQTEPPSALRLLFPDTVTRGQAFPLTVHTLDALGQTRATWNGTLTLTTSAGSISPATIAVSNGVATAQVTIAQHAGAVRVESSAGAVTTSRSAMVLSGQPAATLAIQPQTFLLEGSGMSQALTVRALDADGLPTAVTGLTWQSAKPGVVVVAANGVATAAGSGSSSITARAGLLTSAPALAFVTTPATGVVLIPDDRIVGSITPVDPQARYGPGWKYRVRMSGPAPQVGQVLASRGEKALAGRVIGVLAAATDTTDVTLQLAPLDQVFPNLSINESMPLRFDPEKRSHFATRSRAPWMAIVNNEFSAGPFTCTLKLEGADNSPFEVVSVTQDVSPTLQFDFIHNESRQRLVVHGSLSASLKLSTNVMVGLEGSFECKAQAGQIPIPVGGALALFFGMRVPLGLGFAFEGAITLATLGFDIEVSAGTLLSMGYDCNPTCTSILNMTGNSSGRAKLNLPQPGSDFRVTGGVKGFAWADLEIGPASYLPGADDLQLTLLESQAGVEQGFDMAPAEVQAEDADYASNYSMASYFSGGIPDELKARIDTLLGMVGIGLPPLTLEIDGPAFAESPAGSFQIVPSRVRPATSTSPGDTATFIVDLSRTEYLTQYAVESVRLFRKPAGGSLVPAPGPCASMTASSGQSLFTCKTSLPDTLSGEQTFYAFVRPILGVALPVTLEVSPDSRDVLLVDTTTTVYQTDFGGPVDPVWSFPTKLVSPAGQHYLGPFNNDAVRLSLANLPAHTKLQVELDLYLVRSWDGSNTEPGNGPDLVTITIADTTVLQATFSNVNNRPDHQQSYPGSFPGSLHAAGTGAMSKNTLGYSPLSGHHNSDSIYRLTFEINHTDASIVLQVKGANLSALPDEWWGLDNIRVTVR